MNPTWTVGEVTAVTCISLWFLFVVIIAAGFMSSARTWPAMSARPVRSSILVGSVWCGVFSTIIPASIVFSVPALVWNAASIIVWETFALFMSTVFGLVYRTWLSRDVAHQH